jgi:hypothetical protein
MKNLGPPIGGQLRSETRLRVAGSRPHSRSDTWRASPRSNTSSSLSERTAHGAVPSGTVVTLGLRARRRSRFEVTFHGIQIVKSSASPICDAASVLRRRVYLDRCLLIVWHAGADHQAISGPLGFWRERRIREDRGMPRYVAWEPRPRRVGAKNGNGKPKAVGHGVKKKSALAAAPGPDEGQSAAILRRLARAARERR